ncbi:hypothetical protein Acr_07g0011850 [Actinidia rufa]|uniref:Uncharacterized protein n=1 Tax=Actinidia rufa TaxID=165716 RepID=A0A7J0EYD8_9ERIC|nr:hypothetical protein Acr_07g0011850 [Actinidia rufa]
MDSTRQEDEGDEGASHHAMEVEENLEVPLNQTEETYVDPSAQNLQLHWQSEETMHGEDPMHEKVLMQGKYPMHGGHPSQEGTSSQGGPPAWFLEYFGKMNKTTEKIEQRQEEIFQKQEKQGKYIDRLGDLYKNLYKQQTAFNQQYSNQMNDIVAQLEGLWVYLVPPPPSPSFNASNAPPRPPYHAPPY